MKYVLSIVTLILCQACANYHYANKVKMVSFTDDLSKGKSTGMIRGEDCTWTILGTKLGGTPTLDKAFLNTQNQSNELASVGLDSKTSGKELRYVNNVTTENSGFNALLFAKECLVVKGIGYR